MARELQINLTVGVIEGFWLSLMLAIGIAFGIVAAAEIQRAIALERIERQVDRAVDR